MNIREALEEAVAERGADYVYPKNEPGWTNGNNGVTCLYVTGPTAEKPGEPACLVGLALSKMGVPANVLDVHGPVDFLYDEVGDQLPALTSAELSALARAQSAQDGGHTWGEALTEFNQALGPVVSA